MHVKKQQLKPIVKVIDKHLFERAQVDSKLKVYESMAGSSLFWVLY